MNIIPAIDLLNGEAVRLYQGSYDQVKSYSRDPVETALKFQSEGAKHLHVVDLDAARWKGGDPSGKKHNREQIRRIAEATEMTLEVGGGIRSDEDIRELMDAGIRRLVVGTLLVKNPGMVRSWIERYDADFIAGIDARDGEVKIAGWEDGSSVKDDVLASSMADLGVKGIIYTNISLDGTLKGPDIQRALHIAEASGLPVTVSGGMGSMSDCRDVAEAAAANPGAENIPMIEGVIIGKALYEGSISLAEAIMLYQNGGDDV